MARILVRVMSELLISGKGHKQNGVPRMWADAVLVEDAIAGLEGDLSSDLQDAVVTRTRHGTQSG